jgi:hypothetical protein
LAFGVPQQLGFARQLAVAQQKQLHFFPSRSKR